MSNEFEEVYIGDGVYARWDGFSVLLKTERENGTHYIYLEPGHVTALAKLIDARNAIVAPSISGGPSEEARLLAFQVFGSFSAAQVPFDALDHNAQRAITLAKEILRLASPLPATNLIEGKS